MLSFYHGCYAYILLPRFDKFITWWMKTWNRSSTMTERRLTQTTNCISILMFEPFQIPVHLVKPSRICSFLNRCTQKPLCRSSPFIFKTVAQAGVDVLVCLVRVQYRVCPQRKVPCMRHGKQLIIAISWGHLVRGDRGECSSSHKVCERSTHARRAKSR